MKIDLTIKYKKSILDIITYNTRIIVYCWQQSSYHIYFSSRKADNLEFYKAENIIDYKKVRKQTQAWIKCLHVWNELEKI
jgi:hypothetical protein